MRRWTAMGPALNGCHEIAPEVAARFVELGGQDIEVWGEEYTIFSDTQEAADYAATELTLTCVEETTEE